MNAETGSHAVLWPMLSLVGLTAVVWCVMYWRRITEIRRNRIPVQSLATRKAASSRLEDVRSADNFANLLETPVLFYAVCLVLVVTGTETTAQVALAWAYVAGRALHSAIHVSYNRVAHRFIAYVLSTLCLWTMWALLAIELAGRAAG